MAATQEFSVFPDEGVCLAGVGVTGERGGRSLTRTNLKQAGGMDADEINRTLATGSTGISGIYLHSESSRSRAAKVEMQQLGAIRFEVAKRAGWLKRAS